MGLLATALGAWHTLAGHFSLYIQLISLSSLLCYVTSALIHGELITISLVMLQYVCVAAANKTLFLGR